MPISKIPVIHKFGILSQSHQADVKRRIEEQTIQESIDAIKIPLNSVKSIDVGKCLQQLHEADDEEKILNHLEKLDVHMQKLKFQLKNLDLKHGVLKLEVCWRELFIISTSKMSKLKSDALSILHGSVTSTPLSRQLLAVLLEIGVGCLQLVYIDEQVNSINNRLLLKVTHALAVRLYYHSLLADFEESSFEDMKVMHTMNEGVRKLLCDFKNNPINYVMLQNITCMVEAICKMHFDFSKSSEDSKDEAIIFKWSKITEKCFNMQLTNSLKLWHCLKRQIEPSSELVLAIQENEFSFSQTSKGGIWLDNIFSIFCLCECAKLQEEYLVSFLRISKQFASPSKFRSINRIPWEFVCNYLKCLADIAAYGQTIELRKTALLGKDGYKGLTDYLTLDESFEVQYTCYQLLYDLTNVNNLDEGLSANIWHVISRYEYKLADDRFFSIIKVNKEESLVSPGPLYSNISTCLCVVYFADKCNRNVTSQSSVKRSEIKNVQPQQKDDLSPLKKMDTYTKKKCYLPHKKKNPPRPLEINQDFDRENELRNVIDEHVLKEKLEDELERMNILNNE